MDSRLIYSTHKNVGKADMSWLQLTNDQRNLKLVIEDWFDLVHSWKIHGWLGFPKADIEHSSEFWLNTQYNFVTVYRLQSAGY